MSVLVDFAVAPVSTRDFTATATRAGSKVLVSFLGNADMDAREPLEAFLVQLHGEARRCGAEQVVIDFQHLEFMNSSCFKGFVSWLSELQELPPEQQYLIHFRSNGAMLWQRRSLHALRCFAVDLVTVGT